MVVEQIREQMCVSGEQAWSRGWRMSYFLTDFDGGSGLELQSNLFCDISCRAVVEFEGLERIHAFPNLLSKGRV